MDSKLSQLAIVVVATALPAFSQPTIFSNVTGYWDLATGSGQTVAVEFTSPVNAQLIGVEAFLNEFDPNNPAEPITFSLYSDNGGPDTLLATLTGTVPAANGTPPPITLSGVPSASVTLMTGANYWLAMTLPPGVGWLLNGSSLQPYDLYDGAWVSVGSQAVQFAILGSAGTVTIDGLGCPFAILDWTRPFGGSDLDITKPVDRCTPLLFEAAANGRKFSSATLTTQGATLMLTDVVVIDDRASGATESVDLRFSDIEISYAISGQVTLSGSGMSGVALTLSGSQSGTATTDNSGNYSFTEAAGANYTVTPSLSGYTFSPPSQTFDNLSGYQVANFSASPLVTTSGLLFISTPPCRVVDTRDAAEPSGFGPPFLSGDAARSFSIPSGACGIPATAQAYSLNVTVVPDGELGYLTVWPTGQSQPLVSTLNSLDGDVQANAAIVAGGTGGALSVFATDDTDLVMDINGYFVPNTVSSGLGFYPMTPCRLADTRPGAASTIITGALTGGTSTSLPILSSSCNVPATAQAYSLNFTLVPPAAVNYLTVYPTGESLPIVSTMNDPAGTVEANAAIAPAGVGGSIDVYVTQTTNLVVDINGYFAPVGEGALSLYTVPPCRVLDTRNPPGSAPFEGTINVNAIGSDCGLISAAQAFVFNATVVPEGPLGYLTLWPQGSVQPLVSTLNAYNGDITSNMAIVPTSNTEISAFATSSTYLILDSFGYFAP
jgi:hypothetical protein